jgi:hypothetical protein
MKSWGRPSYITAVKVTAILTILSLGLVLSSMGYTPQVGDSSEMVLRNLGAPIGCVGEPGGDQIFTYATGMIGFQEGRVAWSDYVTPAEQAAREKSEELREQSRARDRHAEAERIKNVYLSDPNMALLSDSSIVEIWEGFRLRFPSEQLPAVYQEAKNRLAETEAREQEARDREQEERLEREKLEAEYARLDRWMTPVYSYDPFISAGTIISIQENALCELRASRAAAFRAHNAAEVRRLDAQICDTKNFIRGIQLRFSWAPFPSPVKPCPPVACK